MTQYIVYVNGYSWYEVEAETEEEAEDLVFDHRSGITTPQIANHGDETSSVSVQIDTDATT